MSWKSTQTSSIIIQATVEAMIRTGEEYCESIRDGREVYINGKVFWKAGTNGNGHGGFLDTTAAAVKSKSV